MSPEGKEWKALVKESKTAQRLREGYRRSTWQTALNFRRWRRRKKLSGVVGGSSLLFQADSFKRGRVRKNGGIPVNWTAVSHLIMAHPEMHTHIKHTHALYCILFISPLLYSSHLLCLSQSMLVTLFLFFNRPSLHKSLNLVTHCENTTLTDNTQAYTFSYAYKQNNKLTST